MQQIFQHREEGKHEIEIDKRYERLRFFEGRQGYDVVDKGGEAVRLEDEFLYKAGFLVETQEGMGYEVFKPQHKNALRAKLKRAFRKMVYCLLQQEYDERDNGIQADRMSIASGNSQMFRDKLVGKIERARVRKRRLAEIKALLREVTRMGGRKC